MKIIYKFMDETSVNDIFNISKECFSTPWSIESITAELNNPLAKYIIAIDEETNLVVGFIGAWIIVGEASITNIAVTSNYRNKGIANNLIHSLIKVCLDLNCYLINLEVRASNVKAQNLYKKNGFLVDGLRKGYYEDTKEDAILMTKNL